MFLVPKTILQMVFGTRDRKPSGLGSVIANFGQTVGGFAGVTVGGLVSRGTKFGKASLPPPIHYAHPR